MKAQLNVRLEKSLVLQVQKAAKQQGRTLAACVAMALEQWLAAPSSAPQEPLPINRLEELEKRLERLEQQSSQGLRRRSTWKCHNLKPKAAKAAPAKPSTTVPAGEAIPTAALADLFNIKRGALNARIGRAGGAAPGLVIEGWCCVGLAVPKRGGPAQALWQQA
jgi:hypothetical protein